MKPYKDETFTSGLSDGNHIVAPNWIYFAVELESKKTDVSMMRMNLKRCWATPTYVFCDKKNAIFQYM